MATFKVVAYYSKRDGSANIKIRVLHHDAQRRVATGLHALPGDVTPNGRIKSASLQRQCDALLHRCLALANELSPRLAAMSIDELAERVRATITGDSAFRLDFLGYIREIAGKMNRGTGSLYITAANALCRFIKRDTLDVSEVTGKLLRDFMEFLRTEPSQRGSNRRGVGEALPKGGRAVSLYMARLRAAYNRASLEFNEPEHGVLCIPPSPFERIHIDAPAPPRKRARDARGEQQPQEEVPDGATQRRSFLRPDLHRRSSSMSLGSASRPWLTRRKSPRVTERTRRTTSRSTPA